MLYNINEHNSIEAHNPTIKPKSYNALMTTILLVGYQ